MVFLFLFTFKKTLVTSLFYIAQRNRQLTAKLASSIKTNFWTNLMLAPSSMAENFVDAGTFPVEAPVKGDIKF